MNITSWLITGFGAAVLGALIASFAEIGQKYLITVKKQSQLAILLNLYFILALAGIMIALAFNRFTFNPTSVLFAAVSASIQALGVYLTLKAFSIEDFSLTLPFLSLNGKNRN